MSGDLLRAERRDLAAFLAGLHEREWARPSLCDGWSVRDVAAHLVAWDDVLLHRTGAGHGRAFLRFAWIYGSSVGSMRLVNRRLARRTAGLGRDEILQRLGHDDPALRRLWDGATPNAHLAEHVIHHQDMRRPLDRPRVIPPERLLAALDATVRLPGVRRRAARELRRRRYEATDVDWSRGEGAVVRAPGEEILMLLAGRAEV